MSLTYAGIAIPLQTESHHAWLEEVHPQGEFEVFAPWNFAPATLDLLPTPDVPEGPPRRVGVLHWPTGAVRPAWFSFVCDQGRLDAIRNALGSPQTPAALTLSDGRDGKTVTAAKMYLIRATPCRQYPVGGTASKNNWYVTLSDIRWYNPWRAGRIGTTPVSWTALFASLASILGWSLSPESPAAAYGVPSAKWLMEYKPAAVVLDAALTQIGQRLVANLDGTFKTVSWVTAKAAASTYLAAHSRIVSGGYVAPADIGRYVPASVTVLFPDARTGAVADQPFASGIPLFGLDGLSASGYGTASGVPAASVPLVADLTFDGTNAGQVAAVATQTATDWYGWRLPDTDLAYPGVEPWVPTGWEDYVQWVYQKRPDQAFAETLVRRPPYSFFPSGTWPVATAQAVRKVKLVASGTGTDGGTAWDSIVLRETGGAVVEAGHLGPDSQPYVLYMTKAADGSAGSPAANDVGTAVPDPQRPGVWLFTPKVPGGPGDCSDCGWLDDVDPAVCWTLYRRGGNGRCACFGTDDPADPAAGIKMVATGGGTEWYAISMVNTCCGCGGASLSTGNGAATLTLAGVHVSCNGGSGPGSGSGGGTFDLVLTSRCCGTLADGRRFVKFVGSGPDACDGTRTGCDNTFTIIAACGSTCPDPVCDCLPCGACCNAPAARTYKSSIAGFTDQHWNGTWLWTYTGNCTWVGVCAKSGSYTSTLVYDSSTLPLPTIRLTHGGSVYESTAWACCTAGNTLNRVSGTDGPASVQIDPAVACGTCTPVWPESLTLTIVNWTAIDPGQCYIYPVGTQISLVKATPFDPVNPRWWNHAPNPAGTTPCCHTGGTTSGLGNIEFTCQSGDGNACTGFNAGMTEGDGPTNFAALEPCSCSPIFFHGIGTIQRSQISGCQGPQGGQLSIEIEVTG